MKKKLLYTVLIIIICESIAISGILLYLLYSNNNQASENTISESIDEYREKKFKSTSYYNIKADVEVSKNLVTIKQDIDFKKSSDILVAYVPSINMAETRIKNVITEKGTVSFSQKGTMLEIKPKETQTSVRIEYEIALKNNGNTLAYDGNFYYLTNFLITPAVYNGNRPVLSYASTFGDPYIYDINNYYVLFKTDKSLQIHAPGNKEEHIFGSNKITIFEAADIRDFPAVIFNDADVKQAEYEGIDIHFINSEAARNHVTYALEFAKENIGSYPYKNLYVVKAPISLKGMEFSNMIFISDKCFADKEELKRVAYHEVLHQWLYGIIGTDQLNEPYFDEGLVNYLSMVMSDPKQFEGKPSIGANQFIGLPLSAYKTRDEYYKLAYNDSAAYFYTIHKKLGNNFYRMLRELYEDKKFKIIYFKEFMEYASNYGGKQ